MDKTNVIKEEDEDGANSDEELLPRPQSLSIGLEEMDSISPLAVTSTPSPGSSIKRRTQDLTDAIKVQSQPPPTTTSTPQPSNQDNEPSAEAHNKARRPSKKSIKRQPSFIQATADKLQTISQRIRLSNQLSSAKRLDNISISGGVLSEEPHPIQMAADIPLTPIRKQPSEAVVAPVQQTIPATAATINPADFDTQGNKFFEASDQLNDDNEFNMEGIIAGGNLKFIDDFNQKIVNRPYLHVMHDVQGKNLATMMTTKWGLPTPRIVLFMLTNLGDQHWANGRQMAAFQKGLVSSANTTSMWLITNGLDVGLSKLIGEAVEKETEELKTFRYLEKNRQSFNVIGIANEHNLSYNQDFFGREVELAKSGSKVNEHRYELNQKHTHFVIMKESQANEDHTGSFLINFIDYLTKRDERSPKKRRRRKEGNFVDDEDDNACEEDDDEGPLFSGDTNYSNYSTISAYYHSGQSNRPPLLSSLQQQQQSQQQQPPHQIFPRPSGAGNMMVNHHDEQTDGTKKVWNAERERSHAPTKQLENETFYDTVSFVSREGHVEPAEQTPLIEETPTAPSSGRETSASTKNTKFYIEASTSPSRETSADPAGRKRKVSPDKASSFAGSSNIETNLIPVVCIVIRGGYNCARLVLENLKRHNPVIVFRGTGGFADLLAFAFVEMQTRCRDIYTSWDAEFVENTLKPLLTSKIVKRFPYLRNNAMTRNIFRDRIIECVRRSGSPRGRLYLSILNISNSSCNLENLSEFILLSLFRSQNRKDTLDANLLRKDFYLTLDWNCAHVALDEVLRRNPGYNLQLEKNIFELALVRDNREDFVDLFLSHGFKIHKYLTPFRLRRLIKYSLQSQDFFRTVCMENIIGIAVWSVNFDELLDRLEVDADSFIMKEFNQLILTTTHLRSFINVEHLYLNIMSLYPDDEQSAERKSVAILAMWAVFNKRFKLAEIIWKHSDQPIHLGLIISMMLQRLAWFVSENFLKEELQKHAKSFAVFAIGVLDACYQKDERRAYELLSEEGNDWDRKTAVDIAANASNRAFIGHPCCQKWLTNTFNGRIRIRELSWGIFTVPAEAKIILSAFLIFPMYFWIRFLDEKGDSIVWHKKGMLERGFYEESDTEEELRTENFKLIQLKQTESLEAGGGGGGTNSALRYTLARLNQERAAGNGGGKKQGYYFNRQKRFFLRKQPPLWTMIYHLWSAPITKFWTYQAFYIIYLIILSIATVWPGCGNWWLDFSVCSWTWLSLIEQTQRTMRLYRKYASVPMFFRVVEILGIFIFCFIYTFGRVLTWNQHSIGFLVAPYTMKVVLCIGVLYFYYRLFGNYLPISSTLGPLLYRFKLMVTVDFVHFMRMALILLFSSGVVIQAILYPNTELSWATFHRAFHRTMISLFLTPVDELIEQCNKTVVLPTRTIGSESMGNISLANSTTATTLAVPRSFTNTFIDQLKKLPVSREWICPTYAQTMADSCPQTGFWPYFFSFQFLIFLKLILLTLLYALFANTAARLQSETDNIWKFQRYMLVIDFSNRPALHAPLSAFIYLKRIVWWLMNMITCYRCRMCRQNSCFRHRQNRDQTDGSKHENEKGTEDCSKSLNKMDYNFWRYLAKMIYEDSRQVKKEADLITKQTEMLQQVEEEMEHCHHSVRSLKTKMAEMEYALYQANISLESIKHSTMVGRTTAAAGGKLSGGTVLMGAGETSHSHLQSPMTPAAGLQQQQQHHHQRYKNPLASFSGHVHLLSRHSPYVGTSSVQRYPIADKYVSWQVIYIDYDPVSFSRKREDFPHTMQSFVDEDILAIKSRMLRIPNGGAMHLPVFNWNAVSVNPAGLTIDRKSWLVRPANTNNIAIGLDFDAVDQPPTPTTLVYKLDDGIPLNPFGRTGLRGKGNLPRWGPNHYVMLIVTRSKQLFGTALMLQFALEHRGGQLALPMRFIGDEALFSELEKLFAPLDDGGGRRMPGSWQDKETMFDYFKRKCALLRSPPGPTTTVDGLAASRMVRDGLEKSASTSHMPRASPTQSLGAISMSGLLSFELDESAAVRFGEDYVQYIDSPDNTDNAWKEMRIFHVHFNSNTPTPVTDNLFASPSSSAGGGSMVWMGATEELLIRLPTEQVPFMNEIIRRFEGSVRLHQQRE